MTIKDRHMNRGRRLAGVGLGWSMLFSAAVGAASLQDTSAQRLIVKFRSAHVSLAATPAESSGALHRVATTQGVQPRLLRKMASGAHVLQVETPQSEVAMDAIIAQLESDPDVEYAEPDLLMVPANDEYYQYQWYLYDPVAGINADSAWQYSAGSGAVVAILDSGILPHEDLQQNIVAGYDFVSNVFVANDGDGRDSDATDPGDGVLADECSEGNPETDRESTWHGTHVAGIVAASANNGVGIHGIAYQAKIQSLRVLGRCGGYTSDIVDAMMWAAGYSVDDVPFNSTPADVINLSLTSSVPSGCNRTYSDAIASVQQAGVSVVVAAGNGYGDADDYTPGNCPGAYTVAATDSSGNKAVYSNAGTVVDASAPGGSLRFLGDNNGIWSSISDGDYSPGNDIYDPKQGTSMAAPMVSGVMAILKGAKPDASVEEISQAIKQTLRPLQESCVGCGGGIVDAEAAVKRLLGITVVDNDADLRVELLGTNGKYVEDSTNPGQGTIGFQVVLTNLGPALANSIELSLFLPAEVDLVSVESVSDLVCSETQMSCSIASLNVDESITLDVLVSTQQKNKMDFSASAYGVESDPDASNNVVLAKFGGALGLEILFLLVLLQRTVLRRSWGIQFRSR